MQIFIYLNREKERVVRSLTVFKKIRIKNAFSSIRSRITHVIQLI